MATDPRLSQQNTETSTPRVRENPEKRAYRIRTMGGDLKRLLGGDVEAIERAIATAKTPKRYGGDRIDGSRAKMRLKTFLGRYLRTGVVLLFGIPLFVLILLAFQQGRESPTPRGAPASHSVCRDLQCKPIEGEGQNECQQDADCRVNPPKEPEALLPIEDFYTVTLSHLTPEEFSEALSITLSIFLAGNERRQEPFLIRILLAEGKGGLPTKYLNFEEARSVLDIRVPSTLTSLIKDYSLLLYIAGSVERERCQEEGIADSKCWGPRLVLVLKHHGTNEEVLSRLAEWEPTLLKDVRSLILAPQAPPSSYGFLDYTHRGQPLRYQNLSISTVTVNYSLKDNFIIIGTSKESIFATLDLLL